MPRQKITTFLWFDDKAEEAARFYVSLFKDSAITSIRPGPNEVPLLVQFRLAGFEFMALNGGPMFRFNEAISLSVNCEDQAEIDALWEKLSEGGEGSRCGWLKDRYGLSWQIVPSTLSSLISDPDPAVVRRVMTAFQGMSKLDVEALRRARAGV